MKKSLGARTLVFPTPVWVIGSYDEKGRANLMTASWAGVCCSKPPCVAVSLRKATYTHGCITARQAFTVNVPAAEQVAIADYLGTASGRSADKFTACGLTPVPSTLVDAPYVAEMAMVLECRVVRTVEIGSHTQFTFPEISEMQFRAILESAAELIKEGKKALPEIMVPVVGMVSELEDQKKLAKQVYAEVLAKYKMKKIPHMYGTMIEIPRACLTADKIAETAEFFSYGTNDLTQMTFGFSRDDIGGFVPEYIEKKLLPVDPYQVLDREGVGKLVETGIKLGRKTRRKLKVGICGEHGGEPNSVEFCHLVGMDYVSCSPFRVPIARLAAAQAQLQYPRKAKKK